MKKTKIMLLDTYGIILFEGGIMSMPLKEEIIIQKSIEFFNDDSPCFIHRSAVMKRLYIELEEFLEDGLKKERSEWLFEKLPIQLQLITCWEGRTFQIRYLGV